MSSLIEHRQWLTTGLELSSALGTLIGELRVKAFSNYKLSDTFVFVSLFCNL